jgi:hypothetical protein
MNLGQWCSSRFAVWVTKQIETLLTAGRVELQPSESSALTLSGDNRPVTHAELQQMLAPILRGEPWTTVPARCKFWGWYPVPDKEMDEIRSMDARDAVEPCQNQETKNSQEVPDCDGTLRRKGLELSAKTAYAWRP